MLRPGGSFAAAAARLDLACVVVGVKVSPGGLDEAIRADRPDFVSADRHRAARFVVRPGQRPAVDRMPSLQLELVHDDFQIREIGHE